MSISTITISAVNYTAYASVAEADPYLAVDPVRGAAWAALSDDEKGARLVAATRRLDLLDWAGSKTGGDAQENAWPRTDVTYCSGEAVSTTEVPTEVEIATILIAGDITLDATRAESGSSAGNTKKVQAGSASVEFFRPTSGAPLQNEGAYKLVKCFTAGAAAVAGLFGGASGTTGTLAASEFCDNDDPELDQGYA